MCNHCGKSYVSRSILKRHIQLVHDRINQKKCEKCEKYFATQKTLTEHCIVIHQESAKSHFCQPCGKSFVSISQLHRHYKSKEHEDKKQSLGLKVMIYLHGNSKTVKKCKKLIFFLNIITIESNHTIEEGNWVFVKPLFY